MKVGFLAILSGCTNFASLKLPYNRTQRPEKTHSLLDLCKVIFASVLPYLDLTLNRQLANVGDTRFVSDFSISAALSLTQPINFR